MSSPLPYLHDSSPLPDYEESSALPDYDQLSTLSDYDQSSPLSDYEDSSLSDYEDSSPLPEVHESSPLPELPEELPPPCPLLALPQELLSIILRLLCFTPVRHIPPHPQDLLEARLFQVQHFMRVCKTFFYLSRKHLPPTSLCLNDPYHLYMLALDIMDFEAEFQTAAFGSYVPSYRNITELHFTSPLDLPLNTIASTLEHLHITSLGIYQHDFLSAFAPLDWPYLVQLRVYALVSNVFLYEA